MLNIEDDDKSTVSLPIAFDGNDSYGAEKLPSEKLQDGSSTEMENSKEEKRISSSDSTENQKPAGRPPGLPGIMMPLTNLDKGLIGWESTDDPKYPHNWPIAKKWRTMGFVAFSCFLLPLASTLFAPGVEYVAEEFHETNKTILSLMVSIFILGFGWGPMLFHAPLSELYGRKWVLTGSNLVFALFNIGCAFCKSTNSFLAFRFLGGLFGCASLVVGGGVIADMFTRDEMGMAATLFASGPLMGPVVGPVIGGFMSETIGWRWTFRMLLILGVCMATFFAVAVEETQAITIIHQKTKRMRKELGRPDLVSAYEEFNSRSHKQVFRHGISRPMVLLFANPVVTFLGLFMAIAMSFLYLFLTTISVVFKNEYGFSTGIAGVCYLGLGCGLITALFTVGYNNDKLVVYFTKRNNGVRKPEFRLFPLAIACVFLPLAMLWYGWSVQRHAHWFAVIASMFPLGFGMVSVMLPIQTYLIEVHAPYGLSASATAAGNCFRMTAGAFFPLAGPSLFGHLHYGWGSTLLALLALVMCSTMTFLFTLYGERLRTRFPPKV
ncbi:major facilitator superfamily domain-containing protein [Lipomyces arxii]|uniref:major facilitator superfamily domain-containing protein n=1 Tax=Lipomyces arxii TaxID=56418 RepID=UPI0034CED17E